MRIAPIAVVLLLSACGYMERPQVVSETPPAVSYSVTRNTIGEASGRATDYCARFNMRAVAGPITQSATGESIASYTCE
jgi:hypothetical protein